MQQLEFLKRSLIALMGGIHTELVGKLYTGQVKDVDTKDAEAKTSWTASHQLLHTTLQEALPWLVGVGGILAIISTYAQANRWNPLAKGPGVVIAGEDGSTAIVLGKQTVLAEHGFSSGRHYWEFEILRTDYVTAWAGVAEAGVDTSTWLYNTGYVVQGYTGEGREQPRAKGAWLLDQPQVPFFKPGDRVGFLLDLGAEGEGAAAMGAGAGAQRTLEYFINGKSQGVTHSGAHLPSSGPLFPAVSSDYAPSAQFRARFDLPCPR